jgi:capsular exopolysaccharide synthesis family protein
MASPPITVRRDLSANVEWFESSRPQSEFYFVEPTSPYREWLSALRRHWLPASAVGSVVMLSVIAALFFLTPQYQATALVMIQPRRTEVIKIDPVLSRLPADTDTVTSELNVVRSRDLLLRLVAELHLDADPEFDPNVPPFWQQTVQEVLGRLGSWLPSFVAEPLATWAIHKPLAGESRMDAVVEAVGGHIDTSIMGNRSYVMGITFFSRDRKLPSVVVNTLADLYIRNQFEMKRRASQEANSWISGDLSKLKEDVAAAARRVADFRTANGLIEGRDSALIRQQISELDTSLTSVKVQRIALATKLDNIASPNSSSLVLSSPIIQELRKQQSTLATQNTKSNYLLAEKHPALEANDAQMTNIEHSIATETQKIVNSLRSDYKSALEHENALLHQLETLKQEYARVQLAEVTLKQLEEEEHADRVLYANFLERSRETSRPDFETPDAVLISHAAVPLAAFWPKKKLILSFGFLLSVLTGSLAALALEMMDKSFRSKAQMEKALGVSVLGVVPEFPRKAHVGKLNVLSLAGSVMTDIYMRLKSDTSRCILLASAVPREGKTTVALLLARVAAINGKRVLLVDGDLRRSGLRPRLGTVKGLSNVLTEKADATEAIVNEAQFGIDVISCGGAVDNPAGVLASRAMRDFISRMRQAYDLVVIDSPAIMAGPDAVILSELADETLLFVHWARTPREVVEVALRRLVEGGAQALGAILSRTDLKQVRRYSVTDAFSYTKNMRRYYPTPK